MAERISSRSRVWILGCLQSMQIAQERAEAVVSCPAMRKVMSWLTRSSSVKPPDSMATDRMSVVSLSFLSIFCLAFWTRDRHVLLMTLDPASRLSFRCMLRLD